MKFALLALLLCGFVNKPMVSLEESCKKAQAILAVELADQPGNYRVLADLWGGKALGIKKDAVIAVDLKNMVYDKGKPYILFLEQTGEPQSLQAVPQMRTEDSKVTRSKVSAALQQLQKTEK
jgi:hypothetical protein